MKVFPYPHGLPHQIRSPEILIDLLRQFKVKNDELGFDGILMFTSLNDAYDPWDLAHVVAQDSNQVPLVAIMPNWEHPIITARKIVGFQEIYQRPTAINWLTGLALRDYEKLGLNMEKEERYAKLGEFVDIVKLLLENHKNVPVTFEGRYFTVRNHKLSRLPKFPISNYVSGTSDACAQFLSTRPEFMHLTMGMQPGFEYPKTARAVGLGLFTRPTKEEALENFYKKLQLTQQSKAYGKLARANTDSHWKKQLFETADNPEGIDGFFSQALLSYSELGFLVTDYKETANYFLELLNRGIDTFLLSLIDSDELGHVRKALNLVKKFTTNT